MVALTTIQMAINEYQIEWPAVEWRRIERCPNPPPIAIHNRQTVNADE